MMEDSKVKDILGKQLQRLSDRSESVVCDSQELCRLTCSMVEVAKLILPLYLTGFASAAVVDPWQPPQADPNTAQCD
jgi:hypothetical protein